MDYIKLNDDGNPEEYDIGNFRRENPNTSFPANISDELYAEWGVFKVKKAPKPNFDALTHKLQLSILLWLLPGQEDVSLEPSVSREQRVHPQPGKVAGTSTLQAWKRLS